MKTQINHMEATEYSIAYSEAVIENMPVMTIAELDQLTEDLGVDILVF